MNEKFMAITLKGAADRYLRFLHSRRISKSYIRTETALIERFCNECGDLPLEQFKANGLVEWIRAQKWSPSTMRQATSAICKVIRYSGVPAIDVTDRLPVRMQTPQATISVQEHLALLEKANPAIGNLLSAFWATGAIPFDLLAAEASSVIEDEAGMKLLIQGNCVRFIYVPPQTAEMIRSLINLNGEGPLFRNQQRTPFSTLMLANHLERLRRSVGIGNVNVRAYRQSAAMRLRQAGVSGDVISHILGLGQQIMISSRCSIVNESAVWDAVKSLETSKE